MKKSPTKSKAKGKAGSKPWPNDTHIWTTHSIDMAPHMPSMHHFPQIQAHVQVGLGGYISLLIRRNDSIFTFGESFSIPRFYYSATEDSFG